MNNEETIFHIIIHHTLMRLFLITYLFSTLSGKLIPEKSLRRLISTFVPLVPNVGKANVPWSLLNPKLKKKLQLLLGILYIWY